MLSLGIESTAHTFGVGIISDKGAVLANEKHTYLPPGGWGIKPQDAAEHHKKTKENVLNRALEKANLSMKEINLIAFSQGPGLPPCLHQGLFLAGELSKKSKKPLIGVNHCIAHVEAAKLFTKSRDPIILYVSGANTQVLGFVDGFYRTFGETQDIGIGNALDKLGRSLGLEFPAGPKLENLAKKGHYVELPYTVKGMDLSFSGLVTETLRLHKKDLSLPDLAFSFQETAFAMLTEVTERALAHTKKNEVLLTGGVGANRRLQEMLRIMCKERKARLFNCPQEYAGDNGVNIAWAGLLAYKAGIKTKPEIKPRQRTDEVEAKWINP